METTIKFNLQFNHELGGTVAACGIDLDEAKSFFDLYIKLTNLKLMMSDENQPSTPSKIAEYILKIEDEEARTELVNIMFVFGVIHLTDTLAHHMSHMLTSSLTSEMPDQL